MLWAVPLKYSCSKHLPALKLLKAICYFSDQTTNLLRSLWSTSALLIMLTTPYRTLSSANSPNFEVIWRPMSLMYSKNISGPRTMPCGTPDVTITGEDCVPITTTVWVLPQSQNSIHLISLLWKWDSEQVTTSFSQRALKVRFWTSDNKFFLYNSHMLKVEKIGTTWKRYKCPKPVKLVVFI